MSNKHTFHGYEFLVNAGQDDEFYITVDVDFTATKSTPDYFDRSMGCWYPGDPAELEITGVKFADADKAKFPHEQIDLLEDIIMDYAQEKDADAFFEKAAEADEYARDCALGL